MITADLIRDMPVFTSLDADALERLVATSADLCLPDGEYLVHEGETPAFWIVVDGVLEVTKRVGGFERVLTRYGRGEHFGDVALMLGAAMFANARARGSARLMRIDSLAFRELLQQAPSVSATVAYSLIERVSDLGRVSAAAPVAPITVVGRRKEPACHAIRDFLARNQIQLEWFCPGDARLEQRFPELALADENIALVRTPDGRTLKDPSLRDLACVLEIAVEPKDERYDVVVVGAGPSGLAAGVCAASEGLRTLVVESEAPGGQAGTSSRIENYVGFPSGLTGGDLGDRAYRQALRLGAEIIVTRTVRAIGVHENPYTVELDDGTRLLARSIVLAFGVVWRELHVPGADAFVGCGIYYGAAMTEALATRGKEVFIVGAGNSAGQAALHFATYAERVTMLVRGRALEGTMSRYLIDQIKAKRRIVVETDTQVVRVEGRSELERIVVRGPAGESVRETPALFVFIGGDAHTSWLPREIACDRVGYVITGLDARRIAGTAWPLTRDPFMLETSVPRIFAVGDVRDGSVKRVAAAVGEGSMAISLLHEAFAEDCQLVKLS